MSGEGGIPTEPQVPVNQPKPDVSPARGVPAWSSEDVKNFQNKIKDAGMITVEEQHGLQKAAGVDESSVGRFSSESWRTMPDRAREMAASPEYQELMENLNSMKGGLDVLEGLDKWAIATGDKRVIKLLTEKGPQIIRTLTEDPNKVFETVMVWTGQETQGFSNKLKDAGMVTVDQQSKLQETANPDMSSGKATPDSTAQAPST